MTLPLWSLYYYIVDVSLRVVLYYFLEHLIHKSLIYDTCVFKSKRHDVIITVAIIGNKCCLRWIHVIHLSLVVSGVEILETRENMWTFLLSMVANSSSLNLDKKMLNLVTWWYKGVNQDPFQILWWGKPFIIYPQSKVLTYYVVVTCV